MTKKIFFFCALLPAWLLSSSASRAGGLCSDLLSFFDDPESPIVSKIQNYSALTGDERFLEFIDESSVRRLALFDRYEIHEQRYVPKVILPDGTRIELAPDRVTDLHASEESKVLWLGFEHEGRVLVGEKNLHEFEDGWIERILNPEHRKAHSLSDYPRFWAHQEHVWLIGAQAEGFMGRFADRLKKKLSVHLTANPGDWENASGAYWSGVRLVDANGVKWDDQKVIDVSKEFFESGRLTEVELHEVGHAQTAARIENGVADPLAVEFQAISPPNPLPDGDAAGMKQRIPLAYRDFSIADESRQFAVSFHYFLHQRRNRDVLQAFDGAGGILPAKKVYGVNLANYFDAMSSADMLLGYLRIFNYRHRTLAEEAIRKLKTVHGRRDLSGGPDIRFLPSRIPCQYKMVIRTGRANVLIPITDAFYESEKPYGNWVPILNSDFFEYATEYLANLVRAMDRQAALFDGVADRIRVLRENPEQPVTKAEYLELLERVRALKSSVSAKPEHLGNLAD